MISGAGTVFISGPPGYFEKEQFSNGTKGILEGVANSMATTIVSGGHLTSALKKYGLADKINHISTAGGALGFVFNWREVAHDRIIRRCCR